MAILDVSRSTGEGPAQLPEGVRVADERVLVADGVQEVVGGVEGSTLGRGQSRLGSALRHVAARWPGRDVLLVTDGRDTEGDVLGGARRVAAGGGRVFTMAPPRAAADVGLEQVRLLAGGPAPRVQATIVSSTSGAAEVILVRGGEVLDRQAVELMPGTSQAVELVDRSGATGAGAYEVALVPARGTPDDDVEDDRLVVGLHPQARVVVWWGLDGAGDLPAVDGLLLRAPPVPDALDLAGADAIVLADLSWRELGLDLTGALEAFVVGGGRLLMLGGPEAYAGGGWAGTPLETRLGALRVPRREGTGLALVLVLDRSGSTQGVPLGHLRDAARRALQGLVPGERMGVLPFAGRPDAALLGPGAIGALDDDRRRELLAALDRLEAGGDADLAAAILAAAQHARGIEARERRLLLLTDGDPEHAPDASGLEAVGARLRADGIEFGALVVGDEEAAARLRRYVAGAPEDVTLVTGASELPERLLHRIGALRRRTSILPGPARLTEVGAPALRALPLTPARIHDTELAGDTGAMLLQAAALPDGGASRPFAALRRVGGGEVVSVAWGPALEARGDQAAARAALMPWIGQLASASDRGLAAELEGEDLLVDWEEARGAGRILARGVAGPSELLEIRPGRFRGAVPDGAEAGVRVSLGARTRPLRLPVRPPPEARGAGVDEGALRAIAEAGGGRRIAAGEALPSPPATPGAPLAPWFLLAACILMVVDRIWARPLPNPRQP